MRTLLSVNIEVDGRWPTDLELENRNAVISDLSKQNLGNFKRAGTGIGSMNFSYEVHNPQAARQAIAKAIFRRLPGYQHTTQAADVRASREIKPANRTVKRANPPKLDFGMGM